METKGHHPVRVLVVETEGFLKLRLGRDLRTDDMRVTLAENPDEAAQCLCEEDFDLALIDIDSPQMDALGLLRRIRSERPETKVLMMTDWGDEEKWIEVVNLGADDLLEKPVRRSDVERFLAAS
jgi:DNA-binding response OmpR family regulator